MWKDLPNSVRRNRIAQIHQASMQKGCESFRWEELDRRAEAIGYRTDNALTPRETPAMPSLKLNIKLPYVDPAALELARRLDALDPPPSDPKAVTCRMYVHCTNRG